MAIIPLEVTNYPTGATIYAFPSDADLTDYVADKVQLVEDPAPNLGRYRCNWDTADGTSVSVFAGSTQPASWEDAITGLGFDLSSEIAATQATDIKAKTDLIGSGALLVSAPVSGDGDLLELILETDYLAANGRALEWTFDEIPGITTSATGKFGIKDALTGTEAYVNTTGTVTNLGSGTFKVSFDITNTALAGLTPGKADWSVEVLEGSYKITVARNRQTKTRVDIVEKQT